MMESGHNISSRILQSCQNALYAFADGVGICVGFIRFQAAPCIRDNMAALAQKLGLGMGGENSVSDRRRADPCFARDRTLRKEGTSKTRAWPSATASPVEGSGTVFQPNSTTPPRQLKKYNYWWALGRIEQLKRSGMADPVGYFNNEMSDWWLAPDGMMEKDADFEGIARAIEENWDN